MSACTCGLQQLFTLLRSNIHPMCVVLAPLSVHMYMDTSMCLAVVSRRPDAPLPSRSIVHLHICTWHGYLASGLNVLAYLTTQ